MSAIILQTAPVSAPAEPLIVGAVLLYFGGVLAIGTWATRRTRTVGDFFLAGKGIGLVALSLSAISATLSGFTFIGGPGLLYAVGMGALFIILPAGITNAVGAWVLAKRLRLLAEVRDVYTLPDAIGARYRSPGAQGLAAVAILVAVVGYMATNVLAMGYILQAVLGLGLTPGIWIGAGVTLLYSVGGGIRAGIYTDVFQGFLMAAASVLVFAFVLQVGGGLSGLSVSILRSDPEFLRPWGHLTPMGALSFYFVFSMGVLGQPHVLHKFYMLKDPLHFRWYPMVSAVALTLTVLLYFGVGMAVKALVADGGLAPLSSPDEATPVFLIRHTPLLLAGLVFSGVVAAIMSTINSFMNVGAAALIHDLPRAFGTRLPDELLWGRIGTVVITVAAAFMAQKSGLLVAFLGIFGWSLFASTLVPALAIGMNWKGATRAGAIASIGSGLVGTLVLESMAFRGIFALPTGVTVSGLVLITSLLTFLAVSRLTRETAETDLDPDIKVIIEA